jgi:hypothetical protein
MPSFITAALIRSLLLREEIFRSLNLRRSRKALSGSSTRLATDETGTGSRMNPAEAARYQRMMRDYFSEVVTLERLNRGPVRVFAWIPASSMRE